MGSVVSVLSGSKPDELEILTGLKPKHVNALFESWNHIKNFGTENAGKILFIRFFIVAPETFQTFADFRDLEDWKNSSSFAHHCKIVMNIIGSVIQMLKTPDSIESTLDYLGLKHEGFNITQQHFDLMGIEFLELVRIVTFSKSKSLDEVPPEDQKLSELTIESWKIFYTFVANSIMKGMKRMEDTLKKPFLGEKTDENINNS